MRSTNSEPTVPLSRASLIALPIVLGCLSMLGPFSIDTPFPAFKAMGADLAVTAADMQWVVSAYMFAFGLMSPFHGPLSDALGRRPIIVGSIAVYVLASVGCALSTSLEMLLVFRVLQGLSAGGGVIVGRTVIRDLFEGEQAQRLMSQVTMIFGLAPAIAPIIGGFLLQLGAWPVIFWFMAGFGILLSGFVIVALPESHPVAARVPFRPGPLLGSLVKVGQNATFHRVAWAAGLGFGAQFMYIGSAAIFVVDLLGKGELDFWMFFVPMIAGLMLGAWLSGRAAGRVPVRRLITVGLLGGVLGGIINTGIAASPVGAIVPWAVLGPMLIAVGVQTAYPAMQLVLLDLFPATRGAVVSLYTFLTLSLSAVSAAVVAPLVTGSVFTLAAASLCFGVAGLLCWCAELHRSYVAERAAP